MLRYVLLPLLFCFSVSCARAQQVQILATGIQSGAGKIIIKLFSDQESFRNEKPFREITFDKKGLVNGVIGLSFEQEPGTYGITLLDDENANGKMDYNLVKMPKEGFGFSNFYLEQLRRPHIDEFRVQIRKGNNRVDIKTKYL